MSGRKDSIEFWVAALQERLNEDGKKLMTLPTLDKEVLAIKLSNLVHQVRGPSEIPFGMKVHRLELCVNRKQNRRYSNGQWIVYDSPAVADFFELRVTNDQWEVILSMEARMDDPVAMRRLFQFVESTRMSVLTLKFSEHVYAGKLKSHLMRALSQRDLECVEIYGTHIPDILMDFSTSVSKNQRYSYFTSISMRCSTSADPATSPCRPLTKASVQKIADMLVNFQLSVLTLDGVCIDDDAVASCLANGIQKCDSLECLNLTMAGKDIQGCDGLDCLSLASMDVFDNGSVEQIIGQGILRNESLKKLRLSA